MIKSCDFRHEILPSISTLSALSHPPTPGHYFAQSGHNNCPQIKCCYWSNASTPHTNLATRHFYPHWVVRNRFEGENVWLEVAEWQSKHVWIQSTLVLFLHWFPHLRGMKKRERRSYRSKVCLFLHWPMSEWKVKSSIHHPRSSKHLTVGGCRDPAGWHVWSPDLLGSIL